MEKKVYKYSYFEVLFFIDEEPIYIKKHIFVYFSELSKLGISSIQSEDDRYKHVKYKGVTYFIHLTADHLIPKLIEKLKK